MSIKEREKQIRDELVGSTITKLSMRRAEDEFDCLTLNIVSATGEKKLIELYAGGIFGELWLNKVDVKKKAK